MFEMWKRVETSTRARRDRQLSTTAQKKKEIGNLQVEGQTGRVLRTENKRGRLWSCLHYFRYIDMLLAGHYIHMLSGIWRHRHGIKSPCNLFPGIQTVSYVRKDRKQTGRGNRVRFSRAARGFTSQNSKHPKPKHFELEQLFDFVNYLLGIIFSVFEMFPDFLWFFLLCQSVSAPPTYSKLIMLLVIYFSLVKLC